MPECGLCAFSCTVLPAGGTSSCFPANVASMGAVPQLRTFQGQLSKTVSGHGRPLVPSLLFVAGRSQSLSSATAHTWGSRPGLCHSCERCDMILLSVTCDLYSNLVPKGLTDLQNLLPLAPPHKRKEPVPKHFSVFPTASSLLCFAFPDLAGLRDGS